MIRKYVFPLLALVGLVLAIRTVTAGRKTAPPAQPAASPALGPFESYVAGAGLVEACTENISISVPVAGLVVEVFVTPGENVAAGDQLFRLDDRALQAELAVRRSALEVARQALLRLEAQPRVEDIPPAEARVAAARATLEDLRNRLAMWESVTDRRAIAEEELVARRFGVNTAEARLSEAEADLALLRAGAWRPEIEVARAQIAAAEAQIAAAQTDIDRLTIRSPIDGQALQVNTRPGEFAPTGVLAEPLVLLGDIERLHVRVDIDEHEAWRVRPDGRATACVRGNPELSTALRFVRIEPFVVPKRSLTGDSTERVDTRVLQVLYSFEREDLPVYVGQQMDVFIEAPAQPSEPAGSVVPAGGAT